MLVAVPYFVDAQKSDSKLSKSERKSLEVYNREFSQEASAFKVATCPEEYASESSVVLAKKVYVTFGRNKKRKSESQIASRERILLNDLAAVTEYSEFYYQKSDFVGITVSKNGGADFDVDLSKSIEVSTDIPRRYRDKYQRDSYYKVAVPDLEVGDVIDFYKIFRKPEDTQTDFIIPLGSGTPVLYQQLTIDVDDSWTLYYGSMNGAPEFVVDGEPGFDLKGKQSKKVKRLSFSYENVEAKKWERWTASSDDGPKIKLLAAPRKSALMSKETLRNSLTPEDYMVKSMAGVKDLTRKIDRNLITYLEVLDLKDTDEAQAADLVYKALRLIFLRSLIGNESRQPREISFALSRESIGVPDAIFAHIFALILERADIDSYAVLAKSADAKDDFLIGEEMIIGVYVPIIDRYFWPFSSFTRSGETPYYLEGLHITRVPFPRIDKKSYIDYVSNDFTPISDAIDNQYHVESTMKINEDNSIDYQAETYVTGYFREVYSPLFLYHTNYLYEDLRDVQLFDFFGGKASGYSFSSPGIFSKVMESNAEFKKNKHEQIENWLEREHGDLELIDFAVNTMGISYVEDTLSVEYSFKSSDFVKKAGPNLIFSIGQVSGDQLQLDRDELEGRRSDVKFECPKSITTVSTIELPSGVQVQGLDEVNMKIDNEVGRFECIATQEGNNITMTTTKIYKKSEFSADKWPLMVEFLEAAYEQSQKKVILKGS